MTLLGSIDRHISRDHDNVTCVDKPLKDGPIFQLTTSIDQDLGIWGGGRG